MKKTFYFLLVITFLFVIMAISGIAIVVLDVDINFFIDILEKEGVE